MVLNPSDSKAPATLRWFVAITPLAGAMVFPLVVPLVMARVGIGAGVGVALVPVSYTHLTLPTICSV